MININQELSKLIPNQYDKLNTIAFFGSASSLTNLTSEIYNSQLTGGARNLNGTQTRAGVKINAGFSGIGSSIQKIKFAMKKGGSPTGNMTYTVRDSSDTIKAQSGTYDVSTLTGSFVKIELTLGSVVEIASGDRVLVEYTGGDGSNKIQMQDKNTTPETNTQESVYSGSYTDSNRNPHAIFDSSPTI